ncbi:MAG TPA: phosphate ABC transporter substrate-binding protein PstS [Microbacteriaceae bacterium]|nr:phosphate ABC transporter substrate-binding protein PstS [Microbacteriaceae bacterium]
MKRIGTVGAIAVAGSLLLASCAANEPAPGPVETGDTPAATLQGTLTGSGASSQEKAQTAWIAEFQTANSGLTINYSAGGSGVGRTAFIEGAADYVGSDRAFKKSEIDENQFRSCVADTDLVELPLYISPIAIGYNVPGLDELNLDADTLAKIFSNQISNWNDPAIAALNAGATLPDLAITPVFRSTNSGTTENFTDYLKGAAPDAWTFDVSGDWPAGLTGEAAAETGDVAAALEFEGTIGYLDASRAPGTTASIKVGDAFVPYSPEGAAAVVDASPLEDRRAATDLAVSIDRGTTAAGAYPLVLISYLIGCTEYADPAQGALVKAYFEYMASDAGQAAAAAAAGSAPISAELRSKAETAIAAIK